LVLKIEFGRKLLLYVWVKITLIVGLMTW